MTRRRIMFVVGARPQLIKSAPIIRELVSLYETVEFNLVHSGQHYDPEMSAVFFKELRMPP